jgi:hypothetical protein
MGRPPRKRKATTHGWGPVPDHLRGRPKIHTIGNISAEDLVWIGEDGNLDPNKLLEETSYEPEGALRLILAAIIDAHGVVGGPTRSKRIDSAEEALLGIPQKRGNDPHDDEDFLREIARCYMKRRFDDRTIEIEVAPIAREVLAEAKAAGLVPDHLVEGAFRRLQRKFAADRDRILARATADLKWDLPEFHHRILRILEDMQALGVACDAERLIRRIDPKDTNRRN